MLIVAVRIVDGNYTLTEDYGRGKYFTCYKCDHFVIREEAEKRLREAPYEFLSKLSSQSYNLLETELLFIACNNEGELISEIQPKGNWR
jgi:hypothetical protein